ncbi:MAG: tRNA pseudouridine(38-40) synthase TruA [Gammaproteobacteria bacterium]|nr:tRNA pseudouridine(38-40) synthase TruA [Gammaproteobacteria bacterium]
MHRIALGLEYDGAPFSGWQIQASSNLETVQGKVDEALSKVADQTIKTFCAGRTDSGVHATNQVVHFDSSINRGSKAWIFGANSHLPPSIRVRWAQDVDESFHARFSATARRYQYLIYCQKIKSPLLWQKALQTSQGLNISGMNQAALALLGEHDFSAFRAAGCQSRTSQRRVIAANWYKKGSFIIFDVQANAFLLHMVRNLVGAFLDVGKGIKGVEWISELIESQDRSLGSVTAPPDGLYLVGVDYPVIHNIPENVSLPLFLHET